MTHTRRATLAGLGATSLFSMTSWANAPHIQNDLGLKGYLRTNWRQDPFAFGAYSHIAKDQTRAERAILAAPLGQTLFFAGEALNPNYQSSVHAAYESGVRTAEAIRATGRKSVGIVGAGMAGLVAAHYLSNSGMPVEFFEARDRIGGRIWSNRDLGVPVDLGASWIHGPKGNPISALADKANLERTPTPDSSYIIRGKKGRRVRGLFAPNWMMETATETVLGVEVEALNQKLVEEIFDRYGVGYEGQDVLFPGGYDGVLAPLMGGYTIALNTPILTIKYSEAGGELVDKSGHSHAFGCILVTVPLGVLKQQTLNFDPVLPANKVEAISKMGFGLLDKMFLLFEEAFWDDKIHIITLHNGMPRCMFNSWVNLHRIVGQPVLLALNGAGAARELAQQSDEEVLAKALETFRVAYG